MDLTLLIFINFYMLLLGPHGKIFRISDGQCVDSMLTLTSTPANCADFEIHMETGSAIAYSGKCYTYAGSIYFSFVILPESKNK